MNYRLSDICFYVKEKVAVSVLENTDYISTENMIPNKGGITTATSLPSSFKTQAYQKHDVLVSNIRPYFKKIWFSDCNGGCSNDVLVFRAKDGTDARFLYYVLADDAFFDYSTATSKGTKMPRGDKTAIMQYEVPYFDLKTQKKIARILTDIDYKITLNNNINFEINYEKSRLHDCSKKNVPVDKILQPGDVLINSTGTGTAGRVAQLYDVPTPTTVDGHMIILRPTEEMDSIYYGYAVKAFQAKIEALAEGSTGQTEINRKRLQEEIVISFPKEKETQERIARFLLNVDEKIKMNDKINKNLVA